MFAPRYFPSRYFAERYFPVGGTATTTAYPTARFSSDAGQLAFSAVKQFRSFGADRGSTVHSSGSSGTSFGGDGQSRLFEGA